MLFPLERRPLDGRTLALVDWYVDASRPEAVSGLRREIHAYLERHSDAGEPLMAADVAVAELLGNVVRHASGPAWVSIHWTTTSPVMTVQDLGPGFQMRAALPDDPLAESGRGLFIVSSLTTGLEAAVRRTGGARVSVTLPVSRSTTESHDPPPSPTNPLPELSEAGAGGFGKESFLRALVVQLAQAVERAGGPSLADAVVAQVGVDVGGQMEKEYRAAREVIGRLSPDQVAECFVRLKHGIEGDFYVMEASEERIVLGNRRCPFGDVVRRAPALCRMTSSVFGGIAARNSDNGASIVLEERIAVGDAGCRVVVYFGPPPEDVAPYAHVYRSPAAPEETES